MRLAKLDHVIAEVTAELVGNGTHMVTIGKLRFWCGEKRAAELIPVR